MLYELREYEAIPGKLPVLLKRFEEVLTVMWDRHGIRLVGFWTTVIGEATTTRLHYILSWDSLDDRERRMAAFLSDPEWIAAREKSEVNGPFVAKVSSTILKGTAFSPLK